MSNDTELTEICPHCGEYITYREDTAVLDEIINGGSPTFSLHICPDCMHEIFPCAYCYTDETICTNCPFEKYRKNIDTLENYEPKED